MSNWKILDILRSKSKHFIVLLIVLGVINSLLYSLIIILISSSISGQPLWYYDGNRWQIFSGLVIISFFLSRLFQTYMLRITNDVLYEYEVSILKKVASMPFEQFTKVGSERIYTSISDVRVFSQLPEIFVNCLNAMVIVVCCIVYMFATSPAGGLIILSLLLLLYFNYRRASNKIEVNLEKVRDMQEDYHKYVKDLLGGFKEIKIGSTKRNNIFDKFIVANRDRSKQLNFETSRRYLNNELLGNYSWYVVIGAVLFLIPVLAPMSFEQKSGVVVSILYLMGPVSTLISSSPYFSFLNVALGRIKKLDEDVDHAAPAAEIDGLPVDNGYFEELELRGLTFKHSGGEPGNAFALKPLSINIKAGEVIFVVGANGSGKSTLVNLLTGLYRPTSGKIILNGRIVSYSQYASYSNRMSAIFTDGHLFSENYEDYVLKGSPQLPAFVNLMMLGEVIRIDYDRNRIETSLSKGQQKRVALINSLLENKDILILDEWAAEQDPEFRKYFYTEVITELRRMKKTVIVVSHDDRYYECADRIIRFDYGKIVEDHRLTIHENQVLSKE